MNPSNSGSLPVTRDLTLAYLCSLVIALLMTVASLAGLLYPHRLYPTPELQEALLTTDVVNLVVGLPVLLGSMALARRGQLLGLLCWPGALFYVLYHYVVYTFALPLNVSFLLSLLLLGLSAYTTIGLVATIDGNAARRRLAGTVPVRLGAGALVGLGIAFALLVLGTLAGALVEGTSLAESELALHVSDFLISQAWILGGLLLWKRAALGFATGVGLLFQAAMLFLGLLVYFVLQPFLTTLPFPLIDFAVVLAMGLVVFIPFGLFLRGILKGSSREELGGSHQE
jgi:hypothetical protein